MQTRALDKKATKQEKIKNAKGGHRMWEDVFDLGEKIRSGDYKWEDLNLDDLDVRLKWSGLFHRKKKAPGTYMMRLKVGQARLYCPLCHAIDKSASELQVLPCHITICPRQDLSILKP